jgi:hypothetical protein
LRPVNIKYNQFMNLEQYYFFSYIQTLKYQ